MRNRVTEKDLRDYLTGVGYYGRSAKIHELELAAVGESGWVQVFRFRVDAKHREDGWREFYGVVRDDERASFEAELFNTAESRDERLNALGERLSRARRSDGPAPLAPVFASGVVVIVLAGLAIARFFGT